MGYNFNTVYSVFSIAKQDKDKAAKAISELPRQPIRERLLTLEEYMTYEGWELEIDESTGDVYSIYWTADKVRGQFDLLKAIAPFVTKGSYIQCVGESGDLWQWYFDGATCYAQTPEIIWPEN